MGFENMIPKINIIALLTEIFTSIDIVVYVFTIFYRILFWDSIENNSIITYFLSIKILHHANLYETIFYTEMLI